MFICHRGQADRLAHSIGGMTIGRTLQDAVGSVVLATVADLTREEVRTRAMAIVGMTIGLSFAVGVLPQSVRKGFVGEFAVVSDENMLSGIFSVLPQ